jgi:Uma2 family endonuclease
LGVVIYAPLDVILDEHNVLQPDLMFVAQGRRSIIQRRGIFGAPDLVIEIASPGTERRDREQKKELYARFGVREYWLVDHTDRSIQVLALEGNAYVEHSLAVAKGHVTSRVLKGFKVKVSDVFLK